MAEISMRNKFVIDADEVLLDNFVGIKQVYNWIYATKFSAEV